MNHSWIRGGIAMVCIAAIGGLIYLGLDGGDGASLLKALSLVVGIAGLLFVALGVTAKPSRRD